jgi:hypothetical protein
MTALLRWSLLSLVLLPTSLLWSQDFAQVPYVQGQLRGSLPYNVRFLITGRTLQPEGNADVVELLIFEETNRNARRRLRSKQEARRDLRFEIEPYFQATWQRLAQEDKRVDDQFELFVGRPLQIATQYKVVLNFYQQYRVSDETTLALVGTVKEEALRRFSLGVPIRVAEIDTILNEAVDQLGQRQDFGYFRTGSDGKLNFDRSLSEPLELPIGPGKREEVGDKIALYIRELNNLRRQEANLLRARRSVDSLRNTRAYVSTLSFLRVQLAQANPTYEARDIDNLEQFATTYRFARNPFDNLLGSLFGDSLPAIPALETAQELVANLATAAENIQQAREGVAQARDLAEDINDSIGEGGLDGLIAEGFVRARTAEIITVPGEDEVSVQGTGTNSIRIGTAYGVALVGLNFGAHSLGEGGSLDAVEVDMVSYIAAKFFFQPVDKRFREAYFANSAFSRLSILAGAVVGGDLNYRGLSYGNPIGVKPVLGLSYDFNRFVSVELGGVFFDESSLSPFNDEKRLRASPFLGLSIDADAFNRVKDLFQGDPYGQGRGQGL